MEKEFLLTSRDSLKEEWPVIREALVRSYSSLSDDSGIRDVETSYKIAEVLYTIHSHLNSTFKEFPDFQKMFDKDFGHYDYFTTRDGVIAISFLEDYLFSDKQLFPIVINGTLDFALLTSYIQTFDDWIKVKKEAHYQSQNLIRVQEDYRFNVGILPCHCVQCIGEFRGKLRDLVYKECIRLVNETSQEMIQKIDEESVDVIVKRMALLLKQIEKNIQASRTYLKRASLSKLEDQVKNYFKTKFSYQTEVGQKFGAHIIPILRKHLSEGGIPEDLVSTAEYERFYRQLGSNLWRDEKFILREFDKWVQSVLRLKRKDISAKILQEYLGQFWRHSEARKLKRHIIYHMGPTNSGKTYHAIEALCQAKTGCYLAPLRLLAGELFDTMVSKGVKTTLLTGEEVIENPNATHYSSTIEMIRLKETFECCVIDEIQMMSDSQRGWAWTRALIGVIASEVHICGDDSVLNLVQKIVEMTGDTLEIRRYERLAKLEVMNLPITLPKLERGDALIVFSRKNALKYKRDLEQLGFKVSIIYGRLGPEVRREQARKFDQGETDIIVSTDAIAMGMNLPIKRIVFSTLTKFIDSQEYPLNYSEIKQIAGRAGRYLRFPVGYITCLTRVDNGIDQIKLSLIKELEQKKFSMVGPDLEIFSQVNDALHDNSLALLDLSEFLRLFNTMIFENPFYCVDLTEMIELAEIVENANQKYKSLNSAEIFGFACSPVNLGLMEHVQYYIYVLNNFIRGVNTKNEEINYDSDNIDYLETAIKCVELYQWLSRHFSNKFFEFDIQDLIHNKSLAIEKLNHLLSDKLVLTCSSCGKKLPEDFNFNICEDCFQQTRRRYRHFDDDTPRPPSGSSGASSGRGRVTRRTPGRGGSSSGRGGPGSGGEGRRPQGQKDQSKSGPFRKKSSRHSH